MPIINEYNLDEHLHYLESNPIHILVVRNLRSFLIAYKCLLVKLTHGKSRQTCLVSYALSFHLRKHSR